MEQAFSLSITTPSAPNATVAFASHISVAGKIEHTSPLPQDAILTVQLLDRDGRVVRWVRQTEKNNQSLFLQHPHLTRYQDSLDPDLQKLRDFGFPELLVRDIAHPEDSLRDATIKCFYNDTQFKAFFVTATDVRHGLIFSDGIGFLDENGNPYTALACGKYQIVARLSLATGELLATAQKDITVGTVKHQVICRFNPMSHKRNMQKWCPTIPCEISNDPLPGYLDPYLGTWYYHMGLLPMYRASDIAPYQNASVHTFVYLIDPTSTSYETELAYLQTQGKIGDDSRFAAYHYDIGEAVIGKGSERETVGKIVRFVKDRYLSLCRVDIVNATARENRYDLNETGVDAFCTDLEHITVLPDTTVAVMGVVRPWQLDEKDFVLRDDNTYEILNRVDSICYHISDGTETHSFTRRLMLERFENGSSIGSSVYEFYNLIHIDKRFAGKTLTLTVQAADKQGLYPKAVQSIRITVHKAENA